MTQISVAELNANTDKYVAMAMDQNIAIIKDGEVVAKLVGEKKKKELSPEERLATLERIRSRFAGVRTDYDRDQIREERLREKYGRER